MDMTTAIVLIAMMAFCAIVFSIMAIVFLNVFKHENGKNASSPVLNEDRKAFMEWRKKNAPNDENLHKMIAEESSKETQSASASRPSPRRSA